MSPINRNLRPRAQEIIETFVLQVEQDAVEECLTNRGIKPLQVSRLLIENDGQRLLELQRERGRNPN